MLVRVRTYTPFAPADNRASIRRPFNLRQAFGPSVDAGSPCIVPHLKDLHEPALRTRPKHILRVARPASMSDPAFVPACRTLIASTPVDSSTLARVCAFGVNLGGGSVRNNQASRRSSIFHGPGANYLKCLSVSDYESVLDCGQEEPRAG